VDYGEERHSPRRIADLYPPDGDETVQRHASMHEYAAHE